MHTFWFIVAAVAILALACTIYVAVTPYKLPAKRSTLPLRKYPNSNPSASVPRMPIMPGTKPLKTAPRRVDTDYGFGDPNTYVSINDNHSGGFGSGGFGDSQSGYSDGGSSSSDGGSDGGSGGGDGGGGGGGD